MKEERYFYVPNCSTLCKRGAEDESELPPDEAVHAIRVLRLKEGDSIYLMDGQGTFYLAEVTLVTNKRCAYYVKETIPQEHSWARRIHIAVAPTKMMERIEWFVEKATEIGIDEFSFLECQFSERRNMRADRIDKIVVAAMKQSRKAWKPVVNEMQSFRSFIEQPRTGSKFICHCYNEIPRTDLFDVLRQENSLNPHPSTLNLQPSTLNPQPSTLNPQPVTILIGPEGDFSLDEVQLALDHGYKSVSLGTSRLRTETAALSAVMISQLSNK